MKNILCISTVLSAVIINIAIIGCNRQAENKTQTQDSTANMQQAQAIPEQGPPKPPMPVEDTSKPKVNPYEHAVLEVKVVKNDGKFTGYGYTITMNNNLYINQPNMPGMPGNAGFSTEANAKKAGDFIAYKIRNNIMPPSVTPQELDSLGVLK